MLANITNDSWAGESWALRQHFAMNVLRAVETRRSVAIAALTGVSGWVDRTGRTVTVGPYRTSSLVANLPLYEDRSPYVRWGDWLVAVCAGVLAGVLLRRPAQ
jgi:apolipoprotein N-acyltransferase